MVKMEQALVLLTVEPSIEGEVLETLKKFPGVQEAHFIYGPYDVYIKVEAQTAEEIRKLVLDEIRKIPGTRSTTTCFIAD